MSFHFVRRASLLAISFPLACGGATVASTSSDAGVGIETSLVDATTSPTCTRSQQLCSGVCVDTTNDPSNCGACDHVCVASACVMGACAPNGLPPNPGGPPGDGTGSVVLAFRKLWLGDTDRNGNPSASAWKSYGLNLDGKVTDRMSTDVCTLAPGSARSTQSDGVNGIDNSWGENLLPIWLTTAGQNFATQINDAIDAGSFTSIIRIDRLGTQPNYAPLTGALFGGAPLGAAPTWSGNDAWPVDSTSLNNGDVTMPKLGFSMGYMNNRVWVSGASTGRMTLSLALAGVPFPVPLDHAVLAMAVDASNQAGTSGVLAGVIPTEELIVALKAVAGRLSMSLCQGSAFDSIAQQIRQANDILLDGSNTAGVPCSAISFGIGFEAKRVKLGSVVTPPTTPDPCH